MLENVVAEGVAAAGKATALIALVAPAITQSEEAVEIEPDAAAPMQGAFDQVGLALGEAMTASARANALHHQAAAHIESAERELAAIKRLLRSGFE